MIEEKSKIGTYGGPAEAKGPDTSWLLDNALAAVQKQWDWPPERFSRNDFPTVKLDDQRKYMCVEKKSTGS